LHLVELGFPVFILIGAFFFRAEEQEPLAPSISPPALFGFLKPPLAARFVRHQLLEEI